MEPDRPHRTSSESQSIFGIKSLEVPRIRELRKELGYGRAGKSRDISFYNIICAYCFGFKSSKGLRGAELIKWQYTPHQDALLELTNNFLEQDRMGVYFWPDDPTASPAHCPLQYSKDSLRIKRAVTQIFLRIAQGYKSRGSHKAMDNPQYLNRIGLRRQGTGQNEVNSHQLGGGFNFRPHITNDLIVRRGGARDPIDVDKLIQFSVTLPSAFVSIKTLPTDTPLSTIPRQDTSHASLQAMATEVVDEHFAQNTQGESSAQGAMMHGESSTQGANMHGPQSSTQGTNPPCAPMAHMGPITDPYDGPHSPSEPTASVQSQSNGKRPVTQPTRGETARQVKRPKQQHRRTAEPNARSAGNAENDPIANDTPGTLRAPRSRTQTSRSGYLIGDACFEAIPPSESGSDSELAEPAILRTANNDSSAGSHIPTESTVHPPRRPALYAYVGDGASDGPLEARRPPPPQTAPESGLARQSGLMPECDAVQNPPEQDLEPETSRERERQHEPKLAPNSAPEHSPELGTDHNTNHKQSKQAQNSLPTIEFIFSVVSYGGNDRWTPSRKFQQFSLQELIDELPLRDNFSGLSFVLETPKRHFTENVCCGDEDRFKSIKDRFKKKVQAVRRSSAGKVGRVTFEITIEPLTEKGTDKEGSDDDEALDF
ncbi:hypothetical protein BKA56DRAFT_573129 [Ilyonectria sp. MPI-CAGE-AT-0026]|nr:hypothetical protein BKA56DRAFT_573129 [Ilyonectria sp. MPI-CAGE-AT-0026]